MQLLTINMLGIAPPTAPNDPAYNAVRIGWQQRGQPAYKIGDDVAFVRCAEVDDPYNRVRDVTQVPNPQDTNDPPQSVLQLTTYQRVWQTFWELYGPNSFDRMRQIHSALFTQTVHDTFAALNLNLYWVTDPPCPRRVPYYSDGQWWEFVAFDSRFNEGVTETLVIPLAASVPVQVYNGPVPPQPITDFVAPLQGD
jgi:hypothetical protein